MTPNESKSKDLPRILLAITATIVVAIWGVQGIAHQAEALGPQVGDVVSFDPAHRSPFTSTAKLTADRPDRASCELDVAFMQKSGGSLVVNQKETAPTRIYRAHWVGPRTSESTGDCGADAELTLSPADLAALAAAAGGLGLHLY
jgi:hypothetical protein